MFGTSRSSSWRSTHNCGSSFPVQEGGRHGVGESSRVADRDDVLSYLNEVRVSMPHWFKVHGLYLQ
jgi:hypothetical protein